MSLAGSELRPRVESRVKRFLLEARTVVGVRQSRHPTTVPIRICELFDDPGPFLGWKLLHPRIR
jgi:hypothetical protein